MSWVPHFVKSRLMHLMNNIIFFYIKLSSSLSILLFKLFRLDRMTSFLLTAIDCDLERSRDSCKFSIDSSEVAESFLMGFTCVLNCLKNLNSPAKASLKVI